MPNYGVDLAAKLKLISEHWSRKLIAQRQRRAKAGSASCLSRGWTSTTTHWPSALTSQNRRLAALVVAGAVFGISISVIKGNHAGVRDTIGNVSAPWLLLPFVSSAVAGRTKLAVGAAVGLTVSITAILGFYVSNAAVLDLGPHPWLVDLRLAVEGGRMYVALALLSGPMFGALGASWQRRRPLALGIAVASLLVFEPVAWLLYQRGADSVVASYPLVWAAEVSLGVVGCRIALVSARRTTRSA
jgi:Family of unknown function (DUF6518)